MPISPGASAEFRGAAQIPVKNLTVGRFCCPISQNEGLISNVALNVILEEDPRLKTDLTPPQERAAILSIKRNFQSPHGDIYKPLAYPTILSLGNEILPQGPKKVVWVPTGIKPGTSPEEYSSHDLTYGSVAYFGAEEGQTNDFQQRADEVRALLTGLASVLSDYLTEKHKLQDDALREFASSHPHAEYLFRYANQHYPKIDEFQLASLIRREATPLQLSLESSEPELL